MAFSNYFSPSRVSRATPYPWGATDSAGYAANDGSGNGGNGDSGGYPVAAPVGPADNYYHPAASPMAATLAQPATQAPGPVISQIGPPPSDAMAKALLANEQAAPLNTPFEAVGKLGELWGAQTAEQKYQDKMYQRQVAPYRELTRALSGIPSDTSPIAYRRKLGETMMNVGSQSGNPQMVSKGMEMMASASQPVWEKGQDGAGNTIWWDQLNPSHTMVMDQSGQPVEMLGGKPIGQSGRGAPAAAGQPGAAGADPYAKFQIPLNIKRGTDPESAAAYEAYVAQKRQMGTPPNPGPTDDLDHIQMFNDWALAHAAARTSQTNIMGEGAESKGRGEAAAQREADLMQGASQASERAGRMNLLNDILQRTQTGPLSGALGKVGALATQLGIPNDALTAMGLDPNQATDNQAAQKLAAELVAGSIGAKNGGFPASNFSVSERQFIETMWPNFYNQPGSNQLLHDVITARDKRIMDQADQWQAYQDDWAKNHKPNDIPRYEAFENKYRQEHAGENIFAGIAGDFKAGKYTPNVPQPGGAVGGPPSAGAAPTGAPAVPAAPGAPQFPQPSVPAVNALQQHQNDPAIRRDFDLKYGPGAAAKILGGQ